MNTTCYIVVGLKLSEQKQCRKSGSVILCIDDYSIYAGIEEQERASNLAVTHSDTYGFGDTCANTCENDHGFLRNWLRTFRRISKCLSVQLMYLNVLDG